MPKFGISHHIYFLFLRLVIARPGQALCVPPPPSHPRARYWLLLFLPATPLVVLLQNSHEPKLLILHSSIFRVCILNFLSCNGPETRPGSKHHAMVPRVRGVELVKVKLHFKSLISSPIRKSFWFLSLRYICHFDSQNLLIHISKKCSYPNHPPHLSPPVYMYV